jgi:hypothetical protein
MYNVFAFACQWGKGPGKNFEREAKKVSSSFRRMIELHENF